MNEKVADMREQELVWLWKRQIVDLINGNIKYVSSPFYMEPVIDQ